MTSSHENWPVDYRWHRVRLDAEREARAEQAREAIKRRIAEAAGRKAVKQEAEVDHDA